MKTKWPLNNLYFYLTKGCNLKCSHCWIAPEHQTEDNVHGYLPIGSFKRIVEEAKPLGLFNVKLTGGEPFLHPEIKDILDFIAKEKIDLTVETNGTLCTQEIAEKIAKCKNAFVSVSLDGADKKTHDKIRGVEGSFEKAIEGIKCLTKANLEPQVIFTLMKENKNEIEEVVALAEDLGCGSVKFNILQPIARAKKIYKEETLSIEEIIGLEKWISKDLSKKTSLNIFFDMPHAFQSLSVMFDDQGAGCQRCGIKGILGVLSDGSYALCGIGTNIPELIFGHVNEVKLKEIWNNNKVLKDIRENLPAKIEGVCKICVMKGICLGSCLAQNYYANKDLFAPFWFCEEAYKKGLFPEERILTCEKF